MLESQHHSLAPHHVFLTRLLINLLIGFVITLCSLGLGMWGYHHFENLSWVDAYANAAMILSGMGPLTPPQTAAGKIFAGTYALFFGIIFLFIVGIIFAPIFHRFLHKFHVQKTKDK